MKRGAWPLISLSGHRGGSAAFKLNTMVLGRQDTILREAQGTCAVRTARSTGEAGDSVPLSRGHLSYITAERVVEVPLNLRWVTA